MFAIRKARQLSENVYLMDIEAPRVAGSCLPGQFIIIKLDEKGERIPLTICDYDREAGTVTIVFQTIGAGTTKLATLQPGDTVRDFVGPLGHASEFCEEDLETLKQKKFLFVAGGVGAAPVYPQVKWLHEHGISADVIVGARSKDLVILEEEMSQVAGNLYITTDDGTYGRHGVVTKVIEELVVEKGVKYDQVVAIGPMIMMKFACLTTKKLGLPTIVSMNPIMVDGTGMCGACRLTVGDTVKFACVDGPEFDGHLINFDEAMKRQAMYKTREGRDLLRTLEAGTHPDDCPNDAADESLVVAVDVCNLDDVEVEKVNPMKKIPVREQEPKVRAANFEEVCYGYNELEAGQEATRCLNCKNAKCIAGCPVAINIPGFIMKVKEGDIREAYRILSQDTALPAVCGRVCPQETQCEGKCIRGIKGDPVSIGKLERFVADWARENGIQPAPPASLNGHKVAVIGSGPAGLTCAGELAKMGYDVTIFEALHEPGGVLVYGIPEFRLPKDGVVTPEIENVKALGVKIETNTIVGKTVTIDALMEKEGYEAVFIGSGAGLPMFLGIPGEQANGVFSANEYLTRSNLMKAFQEGYDTPIYRGKKVAVVGGGNVAMDAARTALRLGAETHIVYRRSEAELPARVEEVHHAKEEGVLFDLLTNPLEILVNEDGSVSGMKCVRMELGEPDDSGRRRPIAVEGSEFEIELDTVIVALGTTPNPLISSTTPGLDVNRRNCLIANEETGETTKQGVFAGGDAVIGAATVILAMGAGKAAAVGIHEYLTK
ncbi:MAG: bifunctional dihydroorotate dehydrogenase B NAD binding subunit/NADPH-dependent glutamate synthase [Lachnospiraceae bacterium]